MTDGTGTDYNHAAEVIAHFEGFMPRAYWDVNAFRIGYGSDTRHVNGQFVHVHEGDTTTRADAQVDLAHRLIGFEHVVIRQVGLTEWTRLPQNARAALLSMAYNYGHLPNNVAIAVAHGAPLAGIARVVEAHQYDNRGINSHRRVAEASMIRSAINVAA